MGTLTFIVKNRYSLSPAIWEDICNDLLNFVQDITPVDTGYCQEHWEMDVSDTDATFYNSAEYASFLDDGWSNQAPAGMSGPAKDEFNNLVAQYV